MPDAARVAVRSRALDATLTACVALPGIVALPWSSLGGTSTSAFTVVALLIGGASVVARRWQPIVAAAIGAGAFVIAVASGSFNQSGNSVSDALVTVSVLLWTVVLSFSLGSFRPLAWSLVGLAFVVVVTQWGDLNSNFNPFPTMLAIGPWLVGWLLRSHQDLLHALDLRGGELVSERQRYAAEAVRYERARIARELHDVVAHCMSIVVVQASAGQRLDGADPAVTNQLLDDIRELARQAEADMAGLTRLLTADSAQARAFSVATVEQLVERARSTGTPVEVTVTGDLDAIPASVAAALHRVLQEGLTNAIKHAPSAAVVVSLNVTGEQASLELYNDASASASGVAGGGNGLRGLAERVTELGGTIYGQHTSSGGWLLTAVIPIAPGGNDRRAELEMSL
jgi:signal transduction histidine kinase